MLKLFNYNKILKYCNSSYTFITLSGKDFSWHLNCKEIYLPLQRACEPGAPLRILAWVVSKYPGPCWDFSAGEECRWVMSPLGSHPFHDQGSTRGVYGGDKKYGQLPFLFLSLLFSPSPFRFPFHPGGSCHVSPALPVELGVCRGGEEPAGHPRPLGGLTRATLPGRRAGPACYLPRPRCGLPRIPRAAGIRPQGRAGRAKAHFYPGSPRWGRGAGAPARSRGCGGSGRLRASGTGAALRSAPPALRSRRRPAPGAAAGGRGATGVSSGAWGGGTRRRVVVGVGENSAPRQARREGERGGKARPAAGEGSWSGHRLSGCRRGRKGRLCSPARQIRAPGAGDGAAALPPSYALKETDSELPRESLPPKSPLPGKPIRSLSSWSSSRC